MPTPPPPSAIFRLFCRALWAAGLLAALGACGGGASPGPTLSDEARLGEQAFADPSLSASGRLACASCHAPEAGHAAANARAVQQGGALLDIPGARSSPSLRYLAKNTPFHFDDEGTPTGGFFWDGRADTLAAQAAGPLLGAAEMANADKAAVVARMARAAWAPAFKALYGERAFDDADLAFARLTQALARYQAEDAQFNAFTSKYDAVLAGATSLSDREARGLALFNSPAKGNCAACHPSAPGDDGTPPLFTDFTYDNLGVPRNPEIAANADPAHFDLGLCDRTELRARTDLCGAFKVPSLRNVAKRQVFFHNGRFKTLKEALSFYVTRETNPERWYPRDALGQVQKYDDLPQAWHANVNTSEAPYDRRPGDAPALSDAEIDDVIAFLRTLNDGWSGR